MANDTDKPAAPPDPPQGAPVQAPPMTVNAQYVKDLSFENPRAPASFAEARESMPKVDIAIDVRQRQLQERVHEVVLLLRGEARNDQGVLFLADVQYAGIFTLGDVPQQAVEPLLLVGGPQLLFPFARAVVAGCVRDGGFAPLLVNPIDFAALHRQRQQKEAAAAAANGDGTDKAAAPAEAESATD